MPSTYCRSKCYRCTVYLCCDRCWPPMEYNVLQIADLDDCLDLLNHSKCLNILRSSNFFKPLLTMLDLFYGEILPKHSTTLHTFVWEKWNTEQTQTKNHMTQRTIISENEWSLMLRHIKMKRPLFGYSNTFLGLKLTWNKASLYHLLVGPPSFMNFG